MTASLIVGVVLAALATPAQEAAKGNPGKLKIRAADARTGTPLEGVSVSYQGRFGGKPARGNVPTDKAGEALIEWTPGAKIEYLNLTATKPKFVPVHINWRGDAHDLSLPAEKELRFELGVPVGGVVQDEAGVPIAGATVTVYSPPTESTQSNYIFQLGSPTTDQDGRWLLYEAPANLAEIWFRVEHPDFRRADGKPNHDLDVRTVMTKGPSVSGVVTDGEGRPVEGAKAVAGYDIWGSPEKPNALTDAKGKFTIANCEAAPTIVTVQADGFAPQFLDARPGADAPPLAFRLEKGSVLRVRVIDVAGKPVAGAFFAPDTWRGHRSVMYRRNTDADGRFEWPSAPPDVVLYDVGKEGYMSRRRVPLTAGEGVQTVTLYPLLVVSGAATDAKSGRPLKEFRAVQGRRFDASGKVYWSESDGGTFRDGRFKITFSEPSDTLFVRFESPGYKAVESRAFKPDEGSQTLDVALERGEGSTGVVLLPDGRPAAGVRVAVGTQDGRVRLRSGRFERDLNVPTAETGAEGVFAFSPPPEPFVLVVAAEAGFAEVSKEEFAKAGGTIELQPWGKLEGEAVAGGKPAAGLTVAFTPARAGRGGELWSADYQYQTQTGADGRFAFDRVIPGQGTAVRVVVTELGGMMSQQNYGWQEPVDVLPGATARVRIGGKGRAVVGRAMVEGPAVAQVDWPTNTPAALTLAGDGPAPPGGAPRYYANFDKDGRFRIDDVPPGLYTLAVSANGPRGARGFAGFPDLGRAVVPVEVTGGPGDVPLDLGDVPIKAAKP